MIKLHATQSPAQSVAVFFAQRAILFCAWGCVPAAQGRLIIVQLSIVVFYYLIAVVRMRCRCHCRVRGVCVYVCRF